MHRHLIAGAFACFGSSLFGQAPDTTVIQAPGTPSKIENTTQNESQKTQDAVDRNAPQISGSSLSSDGQNSSSFNGQNQLNGGTGSVVDGSAQSNTNLQNRGDLQPGQLNSNPSTQVQGQSTLGGQQRNGVLQDRANQNGRVYQGNGNSGFQSPAIQSQGQATQSGQFSNQVLNSGLMQNNGSMQNTPMTSSWNSSQNNNNQQQSWSSQTANRVYVLRFDANGREFICVDGRPVYFDNVNSVTAQGNSTTQNQFRAGYGNYDLKNGQNMQNQSRNGDQLKTEQQNSGSGQNSFRDSTNSRNVGPINPNNTTNGREAESADSARLRSEKQTESNRRQNEVETQPDSNVIVPSNNPNDVTDPKS